MYTFRIKKRNHFIERLLIILCVNLIIILLMHNGIVLLTKIMSSINKAIIIYGVIYFSMYILMIIDTKIVCQVSITEAIFCITCGYLTEHIVYAIRSLINHFTKSQIANNWTALYFIIHILVYYLAYQMVVKQMMEGKHYKTSVIQTLSLSLSTLFMVLIMSLVASVLDIIWIHSIYALFSCFFVLFSQVKHIRQLKLQLDLNYSQYLWDEHKKQHKMSKENIEIINQKYHDFKYQISALKQIQDDKKYQEIIEGVENEMVIYESFIQSGNEALDAIITEKKLKCNKHGIHMDCMIQSGLLDAMDVIDIYILFGNLLDNAIEATMKVTKEKSINVVVKEKVNLILIQMINPYVEDIVFKDSLPLTSKQEKFLHGYGLKSIMYVVDKYDGVMDVKTVDNTFMVRITMTQDNMQGLNI